MRTQSKHKKKTNRTPKKKQKTAGKKLRYKPLYKICTYKIHNIKKKKKNLKVYVQKPAIIVIFFFLEKKKQ